MVNVKTLCGILHGIRKLIFWRMGDRLGNLRVESKSRGCPHTSFWRLDKERGFENTNFGLARFEWTYPSLSRIPFVIIILIIVHL